MHPHHLSYQLTAAGIWRGMNSRKPICRIRQKWERSVIVCVTGQIMSSCIQGTVIVCHRVSSCVIIGTCHWYSYHPWGRPHDILSIKHISDGVFSCSDKFQGRHTTLCEAIPSVREFDPPDSGGRSPFSCVRQSFPCTWFGPDSEGVIKRPRTYRRVHVMIIGTCIGTCQECTESMVQQILLQNNINWWCKLDWIEFPILTST